MLEGAALIAEPYRALRAGGGGHGVGSGWSLGPHKVVLEKWEPARGLS